MSEAFVVGPLSDADAVAVRTGDDVLVHISPDVPRRARLAAVEHLGKVVRAAGGAAAAASLPAGGASGLVDGEPVEVSLPDATSLGVVAGLVTECLYVHLEQPSGPFDHSLGDRPDSLGWVDGVEDHLGLDLF